MSRSRKISCAGGAPDLVRSATVVLLLLALASAGNEARARSAS